MAVFEKFYFDMVDGRGIYCGAYKTSLNLLGLSILYDEVCKSDCREISSRLSVGLTRQPAMTGAFEYVNRAKSVVARWTGGDRVGRMFAYENDVLRWELVQLRSRVSVTGLDETASGVGYAERLLLKVMPWKLGIERLSWGRYLSSSTFVMWIVADGTRPIRYAIVDQHEHTEVSTNDREVSVGDVALRFVEPVSPIFTGDVFREKLPASISVLSWLLFGRRPRIVQTKAAYLAECDRGGARERGHAVVESVRFDD
jgi:hypothetical protein